MRFKLSAKKYSSKKQTDTALQFRNFQVKTQFYLTDSGWTDYYPHNKCNSTVLSVYYRVGHHLISKTIRNVTCTEKCNYLDNCNATVHDFVEIRYISDKSHCCQSSNSNICDVEACGTFDCSRNFSKIMSVWRDVNNVFLFFIRLICIFFWSWRSSFYTSQQLVSILDFLLWHQNPVFSKSLKSARMTGRMHAQYFMLYTKLDVCLCKLSNVTLTTLSDGILETLTEYSVIKTDSGWLLK